MGKLNEMLEVLKPMIMMITVQFSMAGVSIFYKLAESDGMSLRIVVAYRFLFGASLMVPLAYLLDRKSKERITKRILWESFLCALFGGTLAQNLYAGCLVLTSATFASAMTNLVPAITFAMAVLLRFERLQLGTLAGKARVVGTLVGLSGAMILTFIKGTEINLWKTHINLLYGHQHNGGHMTSTHSWLSHIAGFLFGLLCCVSFATSLFFQSKLSQRYPLHFSSTALISCMGAVQATIFALCTDRDMTEWKLGWNIRLLTVAYGGFIGINLITTFTMFSVRMRGPVFVSVFNPLMPIIVAICSSLMLNEMLHLGSVIGSLVIITGVYMVLWGKSKDLKKSPQQVILKASSVSEKSEEVELPRMSSVEASVAGTTTATNFMGVAPSSISVERDEIQEGVYGVSDNKDEAAAKYRHEIV